MLRKLLKHEFRATGRIMLPLFGILLLLFAFVPQFGLQGIWISIFTAISAFCNAGFDLFGQFGAYSSRARWVPSSSCCSSWGSSPWESSLLC